MENLTPKQQKTLKEVHKLIKLLGKSPTIKQIRESLELSSDQAVLDSLSILEKKGYIRREVGKQRSITRSISLTENAYSILSEIEILLKQKDTHSPLSPIQQRISQLLSEHDENLGMIYRGAIQVINNPSEDWIAQSAHSLREIMIGLGMKAKKDSKKGIEGKANKIAAEKYFDPYAGMLTDNAYDIWYNKFQEPFHSLAHHGNYFSLHPKKYLMLVQQFEHFLSEAILPRQIEAYNTIDKILASEPLDQNADLVRSIITRNVESHRYFFSKADRKWFNWLLKNNLLKLDYKSDKYPNWITNYLVKIASEESPTISKYLLGIQSNQWNTRLAIIIIASKLNPSDSANIVLKIKKERWKENYNLWMKDLLQHLIDGKKFIQASYIASYIFTSVEYAGSSYDYDEVLECIDKVKGSALAPFIIVILEKLKTMEGFFYPTIGKEHVIESYLSKEVFIDKSVKIIDKYLINSADVYKKLSPILSRNKSLLVNRIKLFVYRVKSDDFWTEIQNTIIDDFDSAGLQKEYRLLVSKVFNQLPDIVKKKYLKLVSIGSTGSIQITDLNHRASYEKYWLQSKLAPIKEYLTAELKEKYRDILMDEFIESEPSFTITGVIDEPFIEEEKINQSTFEEIVQILKKWIPPQRSFGSPNRDRLGRRFATLTENNVLEFSQKSFLLNDDEIHPIYHYYFLVGLESAISNNKEVHWQTVISYLNNLVEMLKLGLEKRHDDQLDWHIVLSEIGRLLEKGFKNSSYRIDLSSKEKVWNTILFLTENADPNLERELKLGKDMEPFMLSVNSTRGVAFHTLFGYIFWLNGSRDKKYIPERVKALLERHLNPEIDSSLAIRSVYGKYLPWLIFYDTKWTNSILKKLFPLHEAHQRYAVWETYLLNAVFPKVYKILSEFYKVAIRELGRVDLKRRFTENPFHRLTEHISIAFAYEVDKNNEIFDYFFSNANGKYRGLAIKFIGQHIVNKKNVDPKLNIQVIKQLWEDRLGSSKSTQELENFGYWINTDLFEKEWLLSMLTQTIEKTDGKIEDRHLVYKALLKLTDLFLVDCAKILNTLVRTEQSDIRQINYIGIEEKTIKQILTKVYMSNNDEALKYADKAIEYMTKLGFEKFRFINKIQSTKE